MQLKPTVKDIVYVGSLIVGIAVAWGTLSAKVSAQDKLVSNIPSMMTKDAVMDTKIDYLIDLVEYQSGITERRPKRKGLLSQ
jgi:hypothetical protein